MFTNSEMIVGLWLVPVVLCILIPLAMLCIYFVIWLYKRMSGKIQFIDNSSKKETKESPVEDLQPDTLRVDLMAK